MARAATQSKLNEAGQGMTVIWNLSLTTAFKKRHLSGPTITIAIIVLHQGTVERPGWAKWFPRANGEALNCLDCEANFRLAATRS